MNPYGVILGLFLVGGLATTLWGWSNVMRGQRMRRWPTVEGNIVQCSLPDSDAMPHIEFNFTVAGREYRSVHVFADNTMPSQEQIASCMARYAVGAKVKVHYNPAHPEVATLELGLAGGGDWLIFSLGVATTLLGLVLLLFGGAG